MIVTLLGYITAIIIFCIITTDLNTLTKAILITATVLVAFGGLFLLAKYTNVLELNQTTETTVYQPIPIILKR